MRTLLEKYLLRVDVTESTDVWYRRVVNIFLRWAGREVPHAEVTAEMISRFLRDKQRAGKSSHYVKSLRNGLLAILGRQIDRRDIRAITSPPIDVECWSAVEVRKLIQAVGVLPQCKRNYYARIIAAAYHTGLSQCDLHSLARSNVAPCGTVRCRRQKTGKPVTAWLPPQLLEQLSTTGLLFPRHWSDEQFRRDFARIVESAGLAGTFKKLRKSSGTAADIASNGRGHEHLANGRAIFDKHYLDRRKVDRQPVRLELP